MVRAGETLVLIDDDESVRVALRRLLRSKGLTVEAFATAEEFLHAAGRPAACLILDVRLPGMSGPELLRRLVAEGRAVPVVFISAYADERLRQETLRAGAVALLEKPFDERALLDAVARAVGSRAAPL